MVSAAFWADAPAQQTSGSDELSEIVVNSLRATTTVAKQDVEIRDLPQAITIVPSTLLDEGAVRRVEDIAFNTVGITPSAVFGGAVSDGGFSRGFTQNLLVDGYTLGAGFPIPLELVDRAEILRGPTSVLYGQGSPGGTENLEFKRPLDHAALKVSATFDSTGTRLLDADVNAPLTSWASGRLVTQLEDSDTFRDFERNERVAVYPMLKLTPTDDLTINLIGGYDRYLYTLLRYFYDYPGQFTIGEIESLPVSRSLQEPGQPLSRLDTYLYRAEADQKLGSEWSVEVAYFYNKSIDKAYNELYAQKVTDTDFQRFFDVAGDPKNNYSSNEDINLHLRGNPTFLGIEHKILAAAEILKSTNIFAGPDVVNGFSPGGQYLDINPINPVYQSTFVAPVSPSSPDGPAPLNGNTSKADSGYINDLMSIGGHFKVLVAARYDGLTTTAFGEQSPVPTNIMNHKISPSAGVVWQPNDSTSIYANYATSFVPSFGRNKENDVLKPEQSTSYEVGIKQEAFDRRLAVTAAVFEIKKRNIVESDPTDINYQENGGDAQSDGFEIEFEAKPSSTLALHGGVAYADARITSSTDYPAGSKLVGPYPWTAELYARQDLRDLGLEHAWVSGNFFYGSARANYAPSDGETIPATYRFDLAAGKTFGHFGIQANLKNVLDKKSFLSNGGGIVFYDTPRSLGATLTYSF